MPICQNENVSFVSNTCVSFAERYLRKAQGQLSEDLILTYICLLEHDDNESRQGACRALAILNVRFYIAFSNNFIMLRWLWKTPDS